MPRIKQPELELVGPDLPDYADKRLFSRFFCADSFVRLKDLKSGEWRIGRCLDISGGGASFDCSQEIKSKTPVELWFDLSDGFEPMHLQGMIVQSDKERERWRVRVCFRRQKLVELSRFLKVVHEDISGGKK